MRTTFAALGAIGIALGLGCSGIATAVQGKPVPPEHADLVGHWTAPGITLDISAEGRVEYDRDNGASHTRISGGVTEWADDSFVVLGLSTFRLDQAPHPVGSGWEMTIDGVDYQR
jgi:hypothetical protein